MLLPGLEEGLEPELYDEVIDILDPDLLDTIAGVDLDSVESETNQSITDPDYSDGADIDYQVNKIINRIQVLTEVFRDSNEKRNKKV